MDKQRIYDAMLIKAFRADAKLGHMWYWLKVYDIDMPDNTLRRQPFTNKMRVQSFVGKYLKPLADRLWDTDRSQDIKTLDWMANLDCQATGKDEIAWLKVLSNRDRQRGGLLSREMERNKTSNQWHVTKPKGKIGRIK